MDFTKLSHSGPNSLRSVIVCDSYALEDVYTDEMTNEPWANGRCSGWQSGGSLKRVVKLYGGLIEEGKHHELYGADTYFKRAGLPSLFFATVPPFLFKFSKSCGAHSSVAFSAPCFRQMH